MALRTYSLRLARTFLIAVAILISLAQNSFASSDKIENNFNRIANEIAQVSQEYYDQASSELKGTIYIKRSLKELKNTVVYFLENNQDAFANAVILANFPLIKKNIDHKTMPIFIAQLLDHKIERSALELANEAFSHASFYTQSKVNYVLGEYYFSHNQYEKSVKHLTSIETSKPLTKKERDYATLIFGIILQDQKKHREALKIYQKIEDDSIYYPSSRLNMAIAHIRQGWWTDAQLAIEQALASENFDKEDEMNNRLLVILGYSQLQHEFYRNARKTFRKVHLNSEYMQRALHGIGLCALSQKDFIGAINAFRRLRESPTEDLVSLESYLLTPFAYNQIGDLDKASNGYADAIDFYQLKASELGAQITLLEASGENQIKNGWLKKISSGKQQVYRILHALDESQATKKQQKHIQSLKRALNKSVTQVIVNETQNYISHLNSYMSQSQYGLAKLYDTE
ncbi:MAG: hypothetical protein K6L76_01350 [Agarilytica sp.]